MAYHLPLSETLESFEDFLGVVRDHPPTQPNILREGNRDPDPQNYFFGGRFCRPPNPKTTTPQT